MTDEESILQKFVRVNNKFYCPYCGKELIKKKYDNDLRYWEDDTYRLCDCDDAQLERDIMSQIKKLENRLPKVKYDVRPQLTKIENF